ncbi:YceI family protein [candidate division KSB1 bacterium]|nr:YceI family protein [candidate division KSB1 bacterium]
MKMTALFMLVFSMIGLAAEFHVDKEQSNLVKFTSAAPLEEIVGTTEKIDGYVMWQGDDLTAESDFYFEVDLASIDTGIGLRNRHMRDNYLETDKYPFASYAGRIVEAVVQQDGSIDIKSSGTFKLHGVERKMQIDGKITQSGDGFKATSRFSIKLADHKIERPQLMLLKVGEEILLDVTFFVKKAKE